MGSLDCTAQLKHLPRLWCDPQVCTGSEVPLQAAQIHYLKRVLRSRPMTELLILNGQGRIWRALWQDTQAQLIESLDLPSNESPQPLWLGVGVLKGEAMDWLIQKATELGVTTLQPLLTAYTQLVPSPQKQARWLQIAREACEQCERLYLPQILPAIPLTQASSPYSLNFIAVARPLETGPAPGLQTRLAALAPQPLGLWIGPEGGWSPTEQVQGCVPISLGPRVLRAETAVCSALTLVNAWLVP
ncbi:RsmE family RNA methyltransferase [Anthocerotibacter panamensis]|uniref:RsmE family RNA methyltransferase n=1 Tax=Anthocerotibacter panamensis TaxID=2857077 RepID=UPI001C403548|nr:RsmE family RNA methyltransferase [Anthocerotibacter panamensis]